MTNKLEVCWKILYGKFLHLVEKNLSIITVLKGDDRYKKKIKINIKKHTSL